MPFPIGDIDCYMPRHMHAACHWLGNVKDWIRVVPAAPVLEAVPLPRTECHIDWPALEKAGLSNYPTLKLMMREWYNNRELPRIFHFEAVARLIADGPKLFQPTVEQFESMEHVELNIPPADFRSPYPAIVVRIPNDCRVRLSKRHGVFLDQMPESVLVREIRHDRDPMSVALIVPFRTNEEHFMFSDQPENPTIEAVINRRVKDHTVIDLASEPADVQNEQRLGTILVRTAMNLCLMMTQYGHATGGPLDPVAYKKHRAKKHLAHFAFGDYLTVNMKQHVVIRKPNPPTDNPPGPGTGIEVKPHWRKGHWRCYPGQAALRAAGQKVPLIFIRPCLVRGDRAVGDLALTETTYHG